MARRGLVSKNMGPQSGSALMPKGEKPKGPELLSVADAAKRLRVEPAQVESWLQKDQLRGTDAGIRPYEIKKFQLDYPEEVKRAQKEAHQQKQKQNQTTRKPKKGFFSKFRNIFGGQEKNDSGGGQLALENKKLKAELKKLQKRKPEGKDNDARELEEKIRYLEGKLSENRALESEIAKLKKQIADGPQAAPAPVPVPTPVVDTEAQQRLSQELEMAKRQLREAHRLHDVLAETQRERDELMARVEQLQQASAPPGQLEEIQKSVQEKDAALGQLQMKIQEAAQENARLKEELKNQAPEEAQAFESPISQELLQLQKLNLERYKRLYKLHEEAKKKLVGQDSGELDALKKKYQELLASSGDDAPAHKEMVEQLSGARLRITKLKEENKTLQRQLSKDSGSEEKLRELETALKEAKAKSGDSKVIESELQALRKSLQTKESQVQKVSARLADNEKRLAKALQESARLTELLIERENRLRELSAEFEQEYRDKMESLDRQVSGLQWKLSLREERIASLESELLSRGDG